jgi:hypothetical protein
MALIRRGWKVPCRIIQKGLIWCGEVNEILQPYTVQEPFDCSIIVRIHEWGEKISDRQFDYLIGIKAWARMNSPDHPCLSPWKPIDPMNLRPLLPRSTTWTP